MTEAHDTIPYRTLIDAIRVWATATGRLEIAHLCVAAIKEDWAGDRIIAALVAIDTIRPDGAVPRAFGVPV